MAPCAQTDHRTSSRRGAAVAALIIVLALLPVPGPQEPGAVAAATARVGPFGTARIDGVQAPGEWDAAAAVPFRITMSPAAGGTPTDATLFLMNNARNLYVAVRAGAVFDRLTIALSFDRDRDGMTELGDDRLEVELQRTITSASVLPLRDRFWGRCGTGQCFTWLDDTQSGSGNPPAGTTDGQAAGWFDLVSGYVEISHPLSSPDAAHDLHVSVGATTGFTLEATVLEAGSYGGSGTVPASRCQGAHCTRNSTADLVIATNRGRISTPQDVVSAIRVEGLRLSPSMALPGTQLSASLRVVNRSSGTLVVPLDPSGRYLGGSIEAWLARLGPDAAIGARNQYGDARIDEQAIDVLRALGGTSWPPGVAITIGSTAGSLWTAGHPPGDYRYTVRRFAPASDGASVQTSATQFALRGVTREWHASVGAGGRNGAATMRVWTTDDGSLGLTLRRLSPRTGYPVTIRSGTCSGTIVTSAGTVTTNASGAVTRTLTLSRARTSAILAAAARGRLVLRIGTGSRARCGTLASIAIYQSSLVWRVQQLPGIENDPPYWPSGGTPIAIAATATALVAAGSHVQNDCTWDPVNRSWACRPPSRYATAVWTSADGFSWAEQILGADSGPGLVAASPGRAVIVARRAAWWSLDGRTWTPSSRPPAGQVERSWGSGSGAVTVTGAGFMAILPTPAGPAGCRSAAWTSADGSAWDQLPYDPDLACLEIVDVAATPVLVVAVGSDPETAGAAIVTSRDGGVSWERASLGSNPADASVVSAVTATAAGYAAYGRVGDDIGVWTSPDGLAWRYASTAAHLRGWDFSWVADALPFGPGIVLVGGSAAAADWLGGGVLVSGDGTALRWAPWPPGIGDATMAAAAAWNDHLYVVGAGNAYFGDPAIPQVWTAELGAMP